MSFDDNNEVAVDSNVTTVTYFDFARSLQSASRVPAVSATRKDARDEQLIKEVDELSDRFISSHEATQNRGNAELYDCIADATRLLSKIESDSRCDAVLEQLRTRLRMRGIKVQKNTSPETILVKTLMNSSRASASQYAAVVRFALNNGIKPADLPQRIASDGGIRKLIANSENMAARKLHLRNATVVMRAQMLLSHTQTSPVVDWKDVVFVAGEFAAVKTFVAVEDDKGVYRVVLAATPTEDYIDDLIETIVEADGVDVPASATSLIKRRTELGLSGPGTGLSSDELGMVVAVAGLDRAGYQDWLVANSKSKQSLSLQPDPATP